MADIAFFVKISLIYKDESIICYCRVIENWVFTSSRASKVSSVTANGWELEEVLLQLVEVFLDTIVKFVSTKIEEIEGYSHWRKLKGVWACQNLSWKKTSDEIEDEELIYWRCVSLPIDGPNSRHVLRQNARISPA